ncbi:MAG TPA: Hpt domain-containing protein [Gammaproteobacteria bacterium]|jgi:two-component system sensor histidine kinase BarA|nr:Hpt domain-containing protein [Gammaproteobacteria bacterium]
MDDLKKLPIVDWKLSIKLAGNKTDLAKDMFDLFIEKLPEDLATIKAAYLSHDHVVLRQSLHRLHGALCYCAAPRLKAIVLKLEITLKNNITEDLPPLLDQFNAEAALLLEHYPSCSTPVEE